MKNNISFSKIFFGTVSVVIMVLIFCFSCEDSNDSSETSGFFTDFILGIFVKDFDTLLAVRQQEVLDLLDHIVRNTAHFSEYAALGFSVSCTFGRRKLLTLPSAAALLICSLYAVSDEIHQYFVPGRACMISDMLLDSCGALFGIVLSAIAFLIFRPKCRSAQ